MHMRPPYAGNVVNLYHFDFDGTQARDEVIVIRASQRRMRFPGRPKVLFYTDMNLYCAAGEPRSASFSQ